MAVHSGASQVILGVKDDATLQLTTEATGRQRLELLLGNKAVEEAMVLAQGKTESELIPAPEQHESAYLLAGECGRGSCFRDLRCDSL